MKIWDSYCFVTVHCVSRTQFAIHRNRISCGFEPQNAGYCLQMDEILKKNGGLGMKKKYKVGEFAKNLGVSAGFLKHHEGHGLLKPHIADSGYRYYEFRQATLAVQCLKLQSLGFTGKEISEILNHSIEADVPGLIREKKDMVRQKIQYYEEVLHYLEKSTGNPAGLEEAGFGHWSIVEPEPFYYMENACNAQFEGNEKRYEAAERWNEYMPMVEICSRFERRAGEPCVDSVGNWHMGLRISESAAERLQVFLNEEVRRVQLGKCLVYSYAGSREQYQGRAAMCKMLEKPLALCQKHHFEIADDIYSAQIFGSTACARSYIREVVMIPIE